MSFEVVVRSVRRYGGIYFKKGLPERIVFFDES